MSGPESSQPGEAPIAEPSPTLSCGRIVTPDWVREHVGADLEGPFAGAGDLAGAFGPEEAEALEDATYLGDCGWRDRATDSGFTVTVLSLDYARADALREQLKASDKFVSRQEWSDQALDDVAVFSRSGGDGASGGFAYGFKDGYWSVVSGDVLTADEAAFLSGKAFGALPAAD